MKIKLFIASGDSDYVEHLSKVLSEKYAETFEVNVCSSIERLNNILADTRVDVMLIEPCFFSAVNLSLSTLTLILCDESGIVPDSCKDTRKILKYNRISSIVGDILENYSSIGVCVKDFNSSKARIIAVWSPQGGVGKTAISLAYATRKISMGKQVLYLNLENFSSTAAYFPDKGKSISTVFEKLDSDIHMLLMSIRQTDSGSGITYFCGPSNYDDINVLTLDDIETLINACAMGVDELVIDLSSQCDMKTQKIFDLADTILIVCDSSTTSQIKLKQFINQHDVSQRIQKKSVLVNNRGANVIDTSINNSVQLPLVKPTDPISVYKALSASKFEW